MMPPVPAAPAAASERVLAIDVLRGLAVIGMVPATVLAFALPGPATHNPLAYGGVGPADYWTWLTGFVFFDDTFRTLFAMLFGAGSLILFEHAGERAWRTHYAHMAVLFAIGLLHATLFATDDVLRVYALAGLALPFLAGMSTQALISVALGLLMVHLALGLAVLGPALAAFHAHHLASDSLLWAERQFGADAAAIAALLEQGREGFAERALRQAAAIPEQLGSLVLAVPIDLAAMALGMGLWRAGMLQGEWRTFRLQRVAGLSALVALPALLLLAAWLVSEGFPAALVGAIALVISAPFQMLLALAYVVLAMAFLGKNNALTRRLAAVGRLWLTNYIATSAILAGVFASWGLGLFGEVTRWQAVATGLVPMAAMLLWSPIWVARAGQGPIERLWRAGARLLA